MGKRKKRDKKRKQDEKFDQEDAIADFSYNIRNQGAKAKSKLERKKKKKLQKAEEREKQTKRHLVPEINRCGFHMVSAFVKDDVKIDKQFLLSSIKNYIDDPFIALGYFRSSDALTFYFEANKDIAEGIRSLDKKIQCPSGELIGLKVDFVHKTDFILNCDQIELLKSVVLQRFNLANGLLDLSALHLDPRLVESNTFAPLSNERILKQVFLFVKELMPKVHAFDLSNNKMRDGCLELLETLDIQSHSLTAINLENNDLRNVKCLEHLRFFPLSELKVIGNRLRDEKGSTKIYTRAVMKAVPFLKILDGVNLNDFRMNNPKSKFMHGNNTNTAQIDACSNGSLSITEENMKTFLEQYYSLFDTPNRASLLQAYVPTAKIELTSQNPLVPNKIFEGQIAIQEFLSSWPETKHDHSSFSLDVLKLSAEEGICQVQGVCVVTEAQVTLQFKRTMKIVPFNTGFCCVADMLAIS